jgi:hypothetical protein
MSMPVTVGGDAKVTGPRRSSQVAAWAVDSCQAPKPPVMKSSLPAAKAAARARDEASWQVLTDTAEALGQQMVVPSRDTPMV